MRHEATPEDEPHMLMRSLSINYSAGCSEPRHSHNWAQLLYAESGAIRSEINNMFLLVPPRRALWIPAGLSHQHRILGSVRLRTLYIAEELAEPFDSLRLVNVSGLLHEAILRVCSRQFLNGRKVADRRLADLIMDELQATEKSSFHLPKPSDRRAIKLAELLMTSEGDLASLLAEAGMSRRTAERVFHRETGLSPARWRRIFQLSGAIELLDKGFSIEDVAAQTGYGSRSAFTSAFGQLLGVSPGTIKRRNRLRVD